MTVTVLRLGHRPQRDKRLSTHLLLAARAFGATNAFYAGTKDIRMEEGISRIVEEWGGDFKVKYAESWRNVVKNWEGEIVHLTMYGLPVQEVASKIRENNEPKLVVVGGSKVPRDMYDLADWNVSVTTQPHSEVSALAIFLHMLFDGEELSRSFKGARLRINPSGHGKDVDVFSKD
ncbi:MAG: tRNA (cytidine(56)-2'-O)-methyltransferase [Candidatus Bathyarchaeota archaeon]|nr:tRNA (cytidine(56)-2'-O)-methyltransferase [Candidatus Bathyarchaeota archaeon]